MIRSTRLVEDLKQGDVVVVSPPNQNPGTGAVRLLVDVPAPVRSEGADVGPVVLEGLGFEGEFDGSRIRLTYRHGCVPVHVEREVAP